MATAPYPLLSDILNAARVQVNDAIVNLAGQTLINANAFTPVYVNRAWQILQQELVRLGYVRFIVPNFIISSLPPIASEEVSLQVSLSWTGYNNGATTDPSIALPQNLIKPLKLAERPSGDSPNVNVFADMDGPEAGIQRIPSIPKQSWNQLWVWDTDQITMPGATVATDVRIDYAAYLPDFTTGTFPGAQTANIMRCEDALAGYVAYVFCLARGDLDSGTTLANAKGAAAILAGAKMEG